jgi:hypothetical protein
MSNWKIFTEIDFSDKTVIKYNIDTRDFHCACTKEIDEENSFKIFKLFEKKPERYLHTKDELIELLNRLYTESGGLGKWRYLSLELKNKEVNNWKMKYIRIFRLENGFVVCNEENYALSKEVLSGKVNLEMLHHH